MIYSNKANIKRVAKWILLLAVLVGTNYAGWMLNDLMQERNELTIDLEVCEMKLGETTIDKLNIVNEINRPKASEL